MFKKRVISLVLIIASIFIFFSTGAADIAPVRPILKLSVEQSPLAVYPPIMIYTAQLNPLPPISNARLVADFYNINENSTSDNASYLGSAPFDNTGKAVLSKQIKPGKYIAIAKTKINNRVIVSNKVAYIVR